MFVREIPAALDFPDTEKPYVESICGRLVEKVSPKRRHGRLQLRVARLLEDWARDRGEVATEWRFYLLDCGKPSSLVPDVAYVSFDRLPRDLPEDARERPRIAPDIAVEILSPADRKRTLEEKIRLYFEHGSLAVIVVDPERTSVTVLYRGVDPVVAMGGSLPVAGFPDLVIDVNALFAGL